MEATTAPRQEWTFAQWARGRRRLAAAGSGRSAGLIAEPSIDFGDGAVTERGARGRLQRRPRPLRLPALPARPTTSRRGRRWAVYYCDLRRRRPLGVTGIWAHLRATSPAYVFTFPNNEADAYFHLATGTLFALIAADPARPRPRRRSDDRADRDPRPLSWASDGHSPLEGAAGAGGAQAEEEDHAAADGHDPHLAADDREGDVLLGLGGQRLEVEVARARARRRRRGRPRRGRRRPAAGSRRGSGGRRPARGR